MYDLYTNLRDYFNIEYTRSQQEKLNNVIYGMTEQQQLFSVDFLMKESGGIKPPTLAFVIKNIRKAKNMIGYPKKIISKDFQISEKEERIYDNEKMRGLYLAYELLDTDDKKKIWTDQVLLCLQSKKFLDRYCKDKSDKFLFEYAYKWLRIFLRYDLLRLDKSIVKKC